MAHDPAFGDAESYFFTTHQTGEPPTWTAETVKEVFTRQWLMWREEQLQPLMTVDVFPDDWLIYLDGVLSFTAAGNEVLVRFRSDDARSLWEEFLSNRCPWLSYEPLAQVPSPVVSFDVFKQEVAYEGLLMERALLRGIREAWFSMMVNIYPKYPAAGGELKCGDIVVLHNPNDDADEGFPVRVDRLFPNPMRFRRDDDLLDVEECLFEFEVNLCLFNERCERCAASDG